ncbi:MAG: copper chaperone PCu(A)C [Pseudomonadota bacterium]
MPNHYFIKKNYFIKSYSVKSYFIKVCIFILCSFQFLSLCAAALPPKATNIKALTDVSVTNAIVYVPLGNSDSTTAIFTLRNNSGHPVTITKVTSKSVKKVVLVPAIPAKADAVNPWLISTSHTLVLNSGKQYLQLTGLKNSLSTGDELQLEVSLSDGKKLLLIAQAKSAFDQIHGH